MRQITRASIGLTLILATLPSTAQEIRARVTVNEPITPVVVTPFYTLQGGKLDGLRLFGYGGLKWDSNGLLGGVGIERDWKIADNLTLTGGLALEFAQGSRPKPAILLGVRF